MLDNFFRLKFLLFPLLLCLLVGAAAAWAIEAANAERPPSLSELNAVMREAWEEAELADRVGRGDRGVPIFLADDEAEDERSNLPWFLSLDRSALKDLLPFVPLVVLILARMFWRRMKTRDLR